MARPRDGAPVDQGLEPIGNREPEFGILAALTTIVGGARRADHLERARQVVHLADLDRLALLALERLVVAKEPVDSRMTCGGSAPTVW